MSTWTGLTRKSFLILVIQSHLRRASAGSSEKTEAEAEVSKGLAKIRDWPAGWVADPIEVSARDSYYCKSRRVSSPADNGRAERLTRARDARTLQWECRIRA